MCYKVYFNGCRTLLSMFIKMLHIYLLWAVYACHAILFSSGYHLEWMSSPNEGGDGGGAGSV